MREDGVRDTLLKGGVAQSPAVSQVTGRGRLGIPAMAPPPVHHTSSPPLVSLGPSLLGASSELGKRAPKGEVST